MASIQQRGGKFQLRVKHKLLPRPFFYTFDTEAEARTYGEQLDALLRQGIVPAELVATPARRENDPLLIEIIRAYMKQAPVTDSDDALLGVVLEEVVGVRVSGLTFAWVEGWISDLKLKRNVAPGTIRKRVGALGRVVDWHFRRTTPPGQTPPGNPLRLLPRGYSLYTKHEAELLQQSGGGKQAKRDVQRDRRLQPDEEQRIRAAIMGHKRADRERALPGDEHLLLMFSLIVSTGMRLFECYRLTVDKIDLRRRVILVDGSKGHRGLIKPRTVPITTEMAEQLRPFCEGHVGLLFPYWNGSADDRARCSSRLSQRFATAFDYAGCEGLTEHDLRHEATCRWFELRDERGAWMFSDIEICRIMGWSDTRMALRYASLRGEDLAARLA